VINGVPYLFQKVAEAIRASGQSDQPGAVTALLGGRILLCLCGGAEASPQLEEFYAAQGLPLLLGYGLTEASPVIANSNRSNLRSGHVGFPLRDVEVRISADGELLVRGPNVMLGYWRDEEATRETITDGWLHTGDLAQLDEQGRLRIVGRRKEMIVLSTGKKVCPTAVEQRLAGSPFIEIACVVGDGQTHLGAIIVPNPQTLEQFIREKRLWVWSKRRAVTHPRVRELFRSEMDRVLAEVAREERVGPFLILSRNFSLEAGEITPKFSLCREVISRNFGEEIRAMYV
jgi:long-chain acyl-CoA synthetase